MAPPTLESQRERNEKTEDEKKKDREKACQPLDRHTGEGNTLSVGTSRKTKIKEAHERIVNDPDSHQSVVLVDVILVSVPFLLI